MRALFVSQWSRFTAWLWQDFLAPRHKWRFKARIALRVNWLFFKRWWRETVSLGGLLRGLRRPTVLLLIGVGIPAFMLWKVPLSVWFTLHNPADLLNDTGVEWRFLIQPLLILIGVPSAFILWAFRDHNATSALENQRKDINLKEFQEIQLRAAGALDEKLPAKARETLQVAAIHQLRPFLRGEYGTSFRRPAWELLKALLATSSQTSGYDAIREWIGSGGFPGRARDNAGKRAKRNALEIRRIVKAIRHDVVALTGQTVINEEAQRLFRADLPLEQGRFDGVDLSNALLAQQKLIGASFVGAKLHAAHLEGAQLLGSHLEGAFLVGIHLEGASLYNAHLEGAELSFARLQGANFIFANLKGSYLGGAHLEGAYLGMAHLEGASLRDANLKGAQLYRAHLEGADLTRVIVDDMTEFSETFFDNHTSFTFDWGTLSETEREAVRKPWRDRGMIHVD